MPETSANATVRERVEEAMREVGVLLVVLAPLDAIVDSSGKNSMVLLLMTGLGVIFFVVAVSLERRRTRV